MSKEAIHQALGELHKAQEAHDLDAMVAFYADQGFIDKQAIRDDFKTLIKQDEFKSRHIDLSHGETFIFRDKGLVRPVVYETSRGKRSFSFNSPCGRMACGGSSIIDAHFCRVSRSTPKSW